MHKANAHRWLVSRVARAIGVAIALLSSPLVHANAYFDWMAAMSKVVAASPRSQIDRALVMTDLAVFNALNAITPRYESYGLPLATVADAAPEAAVAAAAQTILASIPGADTALLDKTYQEQLKKVNDAASRNKGVLLGRRAALAILAMRADDDFSRVEQSKRQPAAGVYEITPGVKMASSAALIRIRPYAIARMQELDPGEPLAPGSAAATRDAAEVKALGGRGSTLRTGDQTAAAIFWNSGEPNDALDLFKAIADKHKMSLLDSVRMMALLDMADYDGRISYVLFKDKYLYWRPYNAIRGKFADAAVADDKWEPLIHTPPNPDYPSGSGVGGGLLARFFDTFNADGAVPLTWKNNAIGVTRNWQNGEALGRELGYSRMWAGVHFRQSIEVGHKMGQQLFDRVMATQLLPLKR